MNTAATEIQGTPKAKPCRNVFDGCSWLEPCYMHHAIPCSDCINNIKHTHTKG